jgi:hypothetical protein
MHKFGLSIQDLNFIYLCFSRCSSGDINGGPLGDRLEGNTSFGFQFWELFRLNGECVRLAFSAF